MKKKGAIRAVVVTIVIIVLLAFNNIKNNNIDYNFNSLKSLEYQVVQAGDETEDTYVITIVDPDSRQPLEGVKIDITDLGGDSVLDDGVAETDEYGKIRVNLYPGKYNVVIVEGIEGYYFADETTQITIDEKRYELRYVGKFGKSMLAPRKMVTVEDGIIVVGNGVYIAKYDFNGKTINIPDTELEKSMKLLGLSKEEAIEMYLEDEGYLENEEVEELTKKAKANKINHEAKADKPRKAVKRERKPDVEKENIIEILANCLKNEGFEAEITNKSKLIEFSVGENHYKLDLVKKRPPKK